MPKILPHTLFMLPGHMDVRVQTVVHCKNLTVQTVVRCTYQ